MRGKGHEHGYSRWLGCRWWQTCPRRKRTRTRIRTRSAGGGSLTAEQVERYEEEGYLVLPDFLDDEDLAPARAAMMQKVDQMAADLLAAGLISDPLVNEPFRTRLAASSRASVRRNSSRTDAAGVTGFPATSC